MLAYIKNRINQQWEFYCKVVKNNSGVSSKNYALVAGVTIAKWWAFGYTPMINLWSVAALIGAIEAILAILILGKVKSEKYERRHTHYEINQEHQAEH